jgi:hypothetical protein
VKLNYYCALVFMVTFAIGTALIPVKVTPSKNFPECKPSRPKTIGPGNENSVATSRKSEATKLLAEMSIAPLYLMYRENSSKKKDCKQ